MWMLDRGMWLSLDRKRHILFLASFGVNVLEVSLEFSGLGIMFR